MCDVLRHFYWWCSCDDLLQNNADFCFVIIFTCEAVTKIIVYGLLLQPGAYLKSPWNILDFMTVVVGIVLLSVSDADGQLTSLKSLRTLRALRPIRMASRAPGMKVCSCRSSVNHVVHKHTNSFSSEFWSVRLWLKLHFAGQHVVQCFPEACIASCDVLDCSGLHGLFLSAAANVLSGVPAR